MVLLVYVRAAVPSSRAHGEPVVLCRDPDDNKGAATVASSADDGEHNVGVGVKDRNPKEGVVLGGHPGIACRNV